MSERTPEEREAARLERERRRAARTGRPLPPVAPAPPPAEHEAESVEPATDRAPQPAPAHEPQPTQVFDVTAQWVDGQTVVVAPPADPDPAPTQPPATGEEEAPIGTRRVSALERGRAGRPPAPPRSSGSARLGRSQWARRVVAVLALVVIILAGWFLWSIYQPGKGDGSGRVVVQVPRGASVTEIGDLLKDKGVIDSPFFFRLRAKLSGGASDLKSGTFTLRAGMSYGSALEALSDNPPPPPVIRVTIPEGRSRRETAPLARQAGLRGDYLSASRASRQLNPRRYGAPRGATLEGFLFPATYELRPGATAQQLVKQQLLAFKQNLARVDLRYAHSKNLTVFDVVTIASMVEREVMVPRERRLVAAVIYNRLHNGGPLGIDATLRFGLNDWTHPLTVSQLASENPYNTRNHAGLPPGPIGNPGLASIEAAAHPAKVPYLFYVVKPGTCGEHAFSSTDAQFERDVARYNHARDAAGGKSPTKC